MKKKLVLTFITKDYFGRPVYKDDDGKIYVDTDPRCSYPSIHRKSSNDIDGEPEWSIDTDTEVVFIPKRISEGDVLS